MKQVRKPAEDEKHKLLESFWNKLPGYMCPEHLSSKKQLPFYEINRSLWLNFPKSVDIIFEPYQRISSLNISR
jgi:hypothetical protein